MWNFIGFGQSSILGRGLIILDLLANSLCGHKSPSKTNQKLCCARGKLFNNNPSAQLDSSNPFQPFLPPSLPYPALTSQMEVGWVGAAAICGYDRQPE